MKKPPLFLTHIKLADFNSTLLYYLKLLGFVLKELKGSKQKAQGKTLCLFFIV